MMKIPGKVNSFQWRVKSKVIASAGIMVLLLAVVLGTIQVSRHAAFAASGDWPTYLGGLDRTGYNGSETIITPSTVKNLKLHWTNTEGSTIASEPVEANGMIYWGSWDGLEHATDPSTGNDAWSKNLGQTSACTKNPHGVLSTATVGSLTLQGVATPVVFVGGGDGQLYALNANTGSVIWHTPLATPPSGFLYSSPAVYNGSVYIGVSSYNDCPEVQGKMVQVDEQTGTVQNTFKVVPDGCLGGGTWGSPAIDTSTGIVYFATGDLGKCSTSETMVSSVIAVNASDLSLVGFWPVPGLVLSDNYDFGNTPTLFAAKINGVQTNLVGIINKNGTYYTFDRSNVSVGPVWQNTLALPGGSPDRGEGSISSSAWDGKNIYVGTGKTTVNGKSCPGGLFALNPSTGAIVWQLCVGRVVIDAITAVPGVVFVGAGPNLFAVNATTGKKAFTFHDATTGAGFWCAASISNGVVYVGNMDGNLYALGL